MRNLLVVVVLTAWPAFGQQSPNAGREDARYNAVQWVQNSPEYRTAAIQAYRLAEFQLAAALANKQHTGDEAQAAAGGFENKPPAVILDVDETVLDNGPFQARNVRDRVPYKRDRWNAWVEEASAKAVPGSVDFIRHAQANGVAVFLVTNRHDREREATVKNLRAVGIDIPDEHLMLRNDAAGRPGDKLSRRAMVAAKYRVVLLIGDSIGDLCDGVAGKPTVEAKRILAEKQQKFGKGWVMIPNPMYGGWEQNDGGSVTPISNTPIAARIGNSSTTPMVPGQAFTRDHSMQFSVPCMTPSPPVCQQTVTQPARCNCPCRLRRRKH